MFRRIIWIILDSVGIGEAPDADKFNDVGADTIGNIIRKRGKLNIPNLEKLGIFSIDKISISKNNIIPIGAYGKAKELSNGKDTTIGHWEMIGIHTPQAFPTYPQGFPIEIMNEFLKLTGLKGYLGNKVASGTEIINELGREHIKTGYPIIYTSADSVFQIAAHEDIISTKDLYKICKIAREILSGNNAVARVIARPFITKNEQFIRTSNRRDFSLKPNEDNLLSYLKLNEHSVTAVGKIEDIFCGIGITNAIHTKDNNDGMNQTMNFMDKQEEGLIFTNLVEFDSNWGHRRDVEGYATGLENFDKQLKILINKMKDDDLLVINADHGCDPTFRGTDHTREYIPILMYHKKMNHGINLGIRTTFADIGATIAENFALNKLPIGTSFLDML